MLGYFFHLNHIIQLDVDSFHFKPMCNSHTAKYKSRHFKILEIKSLDGEKKKDIRRDINRDSVTELLYHLLAYYADEVEYYQNEQIIKDFLPKKNGFVRLFYDSGNLKERYFLKNGEIVEGTHHVYEDK